MIRRPAGLAAFGRWTRQASMDLMTGDVGHGVFLWPNRSPMNIDEVRRAAQQRADAAVADDEKSVDVQVDGGHARKDDDSVLVFRYRYSVLGPDGSLVARP